MTAKAQGKPARSKTPTTGKTVTRRPVAETAEVSTIPASPKRRAMEAPVARATAVATSEPASGTRPKPGSKLSLVLTLLEDPQGASLAMLVEVTGWLPHTTRAALTGLRKRGFVVLSEKAEGGGSSVYRVRAEAA